MINYEPCCVGPPTTDGSWCRVLIKRDPLKKAFLSLLAIPYTIELPELTQDWEIDSWRALQNLVHQDPGEKSSDRTGDCPGVACGCLGVSVRGMGRWWPAAGSGALSEAMQAPGLWEKVSIVFTA